MDRITMAFGPISDVTGFSHKGGMTFLEIQEALRKGHNDLVAAFNNLTSHIEGRNADLQSAFDAQVERINVPTEQYNSMLETLTVLIAELEQYTVATTDYITE